MSKRSYHIRHTILRAKERYDFELNKDMLKHINFMIQHSGGKYLVRRISLTRAIHRVPFNGKEFVAVYSTKIKGLLTVFPANTYKHKKYDN